MDCPLAKKHTLGESRAPEGTTPEYIDIIAMSSLRLGDRAWDALVPVVLSLGRGGEDQLDRVDLFCGAVLKLAKNLRMVEVELFDEIIGNVRQALYGSPKLCEKCDPGTRRLCLAKKLRERVEPS